MHKYSAMKNFIFLVIACLLLQLANAKDTVIVHKDPRLEIFSAKQASVNKLTAKMTSNGQYRGYRVQILNTRNREEAFKMKSDLMQFFPSQKAYIVYQSPYFKVRIGNFPDKNDAGAFRNEVAKKIPQTAYVVEDIIDYIPKEAEDPSLN